MTKPSMWEEATASARNKSRASASVSAREDTPLSNVLMLASASATSAAVSPDK